MGIVGESLFSLRQMAYIYTADILEVLKDPALLRVLPSPAPLATPTGSAPSSSRPLPVASLTAAPRSRIEGSRRIRQNNSYPIHKRPARRRTR